MTTTTLSCEASYYMCGFRLDDRAVTISLIVDVPHNESQFTRAEDIAGPGFRFHYSSLIDHPVPDDAKNRLFFSDEELYAAVPEMNPRRPLRVGRYLFTAAPKLDLKRPRRLAR